ncbi:ABC transporter substrate-binding protein [Pseudobacteriovorax antillogorgiicola]|nr:ABC transporter substrate-binding protein [Pseudobacteriovorax antillogorgiicola]
MLNVFESLVHRGGNGLVVPLAAKSYHFSNDFRTLEFVIDTDRKFSDASKLTSYDFKRSWQEAFLITPNSAVSSLADILSVIEGVDDFAKSKELSGVITPSPDKLIIKFKTPFRMALMHLTGARFSAFKKVDGEFIGTGRYMFESQESDHVKMVLNPFSTEETDFEVIEAIHDSSPMDKLISGEIDIIALNAKEAPEDRNIGQSYGEENVGAWLHLNGKPGRFFEDEKRRLAFQYLSWKVFTEHRERLEKTIGQFRVDFQPFLPFSPGRISNDETEEIISRGRRYVDSLIADSKSNPIKVCFAGSLKGVLFELLSQEGLSLVDLNIPISGVMADLYKHNTADILVAVASVHLSDPDGIYHLLGKNGAITSPMIQREKVTSLLEIGRTLTDQSRVKNHYENVSRAILTEVPGVHIGFRYSNYLFRKDKLTITRAIVDRHFDTLWRLFSLNQ